MAGSRRDLERARDDGLQRAHDLARRDDRVDAGPGLGAVRLTAGDDDLEGVAGRELGSGAHADRPRRLPGPDVQPVDHVDFRRVEHALGDHPLGARDAFLGRRPLFRGLEDQDHLARQAVAHAGEDLRDREQDRRVRVVPAGVHDGDALALVGAGGAAGERQVDLFGHRQRVHVGAQRDHRPRPRALDHRHHAGLGDAGARREAHLAQPLGDVARGLELLVRELGVRVQMAPPLDQPTGDRAGAEVDVAGERRRLERPRRGRQAGDQRERGQQTQPAPRRGTARGSGGQGILRCGENWSGESLTERRPGGSAAHRQARLGARGRRQRTAPSKGGCRRRWTSWVPSAAWPGARGHGSELLQRREAVVRWGRPRVRSAARPDARGQASPAGVNRLGPELRAACRRRQKPPGSSRRGMDLRAPRAQPAPLLWAFRLFRDLDVGNRLRAPGVRLPWAEGAGVPPAGGPLRRSSCRLLPIAASRSPRGSCSPARRRWPPPPLLPRPARRRRRCASTTSTPATRARSASRSTAWSLEPLPWPGNPDARARRHQPRQVPLRGDRPRHADGVALLARLRLDLRRVGDDRRGARRCDRTFARVAALPAPGRRRCRWWSRSATRQRLPRGLVAGGRPGRHAGRSRRRRRRPAR